MTEQQQPDPQQKLTFEQAMAKLEKIVTGIEGGQTSLEESIDQYAEGTGLIKQCRTILDAAEKKIQVLARNDAGGLAVEGELDDDATDA